MNFVWIDSCPSEDAICKFLRLRAANRSHVDKLVSLLRSVDADKDADYPEYDVQVVIGNCTPEEVLSGTCEEACDRLKEKLYAYIDRPASEVLASSDPIGKKLHAVAYLVEQLFRKKLAGVKETLSHEGVLHLLTHVAEGRWIPGGMEGLIEKVKALEQRLLDEGHEISHR